MDEMDKMTKLLFKKETTGINMDFILYIPKGINNNSTLILNGTTPSIGTNTQKEKDKIEGTHLYGTYEDSYKEAFLYASNGYYSPLYKRLSSEYNNPMLIPIIPRCNALYTGYLGYDVYHENYKRAVTENLLGRSGFTEEDLHKFDGLDKQLIDMINYSIDYINKTYGLNLDNRVITTGYSASSKMANFFAALHPEMVEMVIGGGTTGLSIIPTQEYDYPLGFKDLPKKNLELFKQIPQFYYIGKEDQNDSSRPLFEMARDENGELIINESRNTVPKIENGKIKFIRDKNGKYILKTGGYFSQEQTEIIHDKLSSDVQERFLINEKMYNDNGVSKAFFKRYEGNHNIKEQSKVEKDALRFYEVNKLVSNISKKYNYDNKLSNILVRIIIAMLEYYGDERKQDIFEAFTDTYIHIQGENENSTAYLTNYFGELYEFNTDPTMIKCANISISTMKDGKIDIKKIVYITNHFKDIDINKTDDYSDYSLQILIHELNHCIKNNFKGKVLNDHEFEIANGLNHTVFSTLNDPYDIVSDTYENIEEAINTIQEYNLFTMITGRNPVRAGIYKNNYKVMENILMKNPSLIGPIFDSEFNHDDNWLKFIGKENADELDEIFRKDILNQFRQINYNSIANDSEKISDKISQTIRNK